MRATATCTSDRWFVSVIGRLFGQQRRKMRGALYIWLPLPTLATITVSHPIAAAPTMEVRRILILNEVGPSYPGTAIINQAIQNSLLNSPYHLEFYSEHIDTTLFPDPAIQQAFHDFYLRKYRNRKPDVISLSAHRHLDFCKRCTKKPSPASQLFSVCLLEVCRVPPH